MATSDDFKRKLKAGDLSQALRVALSNAIELEITTWVVPVDADPVEAQTPKPGYRMRTRINMVDGDIDNEIGSQFLSNAPYAELQEFHLSQVQRGRETIRKNLQSLETLFSVLLDPMRQPPSSTPPTLPAAQKPSQLSPTTVAGNLTPSVVAPDPAIDIDGLPSRNQPSLEFPVLGDVVFDAPIDVSPVPVTPFPSVADTSTDTFSGGDDFFSEPSLDNSVNDGGAITPIAAEPIFAEPVLVEPVALDPLFDDVQAPPPIAPISTASDSVTPYVPEFPQQPIDLEGESFGIDSSLSGGLSGTLELDPSLEESLPSLGTVSTAERSLDLPVLPDLLLSPTQVIDSPVILGDDVAPSLEESLVTPSIASTPVIEPTSSSLEVTLGSESELIEFDPSLFGEPTFSPSPTPSDLPPWPGADAEVRPLASPELFIEPLDDADPHATLSELFVEPKLEAPQAETLQFFPETPAASPEVALVSPIVSTPAEPEELVDLPTDTTSEDTTFNASLAAFDSVGVAQTSFASPNLELPISDELVMPEIEAVPDPSESDSMADFDLDALTPPFAEPSPEEFDLPFSMLDVAGNVEAEPMDTSMADFDLSALETPADPLSLEMETINLGESGWLEVDESDETIMEPDFGLGSLELDEPMMEPDFELDSLSDGLDDEFDETIFEPDLPIDLTDENENEDATVLEPDLLSGLLDDDEFDETILEPELSIESQTNVESSLADLFAEPTTAVSDSVVIGEESLANLFAEPPSLADYPPLTTPESSLEAAANPLGLDELDFAPPSSSPELEQSLAALFAEPALEDPKTSYTSDTPGLDDEDTLSALFAEPSEDESSNLFADLSVADADAYLASHPELGLDLGTDALDLDSITLDLDSPQSKHQSDDDRHPSGG